MKCEISVDGLFLAVLIPDKLDGHLKEKRVKETFFYISTKYLGKKNSWFVRPGSLVLGNMQFCPQACNMKSMVASVEVNIINCSLWFFLRGDHWWQGHFGFLIRLCFNWTFWIVWEYNVWNVFSHYAFQFWFVRNFLR